MASRSDHGRRFRQTVAAAPRPPQLRKQAGLRNDQHIAISPMPSRLYAQTLAPTDYCAEPRSPWECHDPEKPIDDIADRAQDAPVPRYCLLQSLRRLAVQHRA
jgi:hypothetical protein